MKISLKKIIEFCCIMSGSPKFLISLQWAFIEYVAIAYTLPTHPNGPAPYTISSHLVNITTVSSQLFHENKAFSEDSRSWQAGQQMSL